MPHRSPALTPAALPAGLLAGLLALTACTAAPAPPPPSPTGTTATTPTAYAVAATALVAQSLTAEDNVASLREIALEKARSRTSVAATYDPIRAMLVGVGQAQADLAPPGSAAAVPPSPGRPSASTTDGVTVLTLPGFADLTALVGTGPPSPAEASYARAGAAAVANAARTTTCGWVVDVRGNASEDLGALLGAVAPLLPAGTVLQRVDREGHRDEVTLDDDAVRAGGRLLVPLDPVGRHDDQPVTVLLDRGTAVAGEGVVLAFRGRSGAQSLGAASYGDAVDATVHRLADGATLRVVRWRLADRDGAVATGPVRPDVAVTGDALGSARSDVAARCGG
ncbi:S41 family peptidase [Lapillicoccus jejuensis]|uniref:Peptidase S41-like protein n=1 Tax=Lapillicoccus jejuensis TaxID=402171 RepID=A0A542DYJ9_9MICO|nr:S41 family peptidase [Lapillicoccus jejuensis]TQJ08170.1 peptidase S41-like protein [Lapillicoccus jejuensis]